MTRKLLHAQLDLNDPRMVFTGAAVAAALASGPGAQDGSAMLRNAAALLLPPPPPAPIKYGPSMAEGDEVGELARGLWLAAVPWGAGEGMGVRQLPWERCDGHMAVLRPPCPA